jgi:uncharacterized protein (TIGR02444 family)
MTEDPPSLWNFAVAVYGQPKIATLCLRLQDEHDFDVNLLLWCLWYGEHYGQIDAALMDRALEFSRLWQEQVVAPLRRTRRWLRHQRPAADHGSGMEELRQQVKACELASERLQLDRLQTLRAVSAPASSRGVSNTGDARVDVTGNLTCLQQRVAANASLSEQDAASHTLGELVNHYCQGNSGSAD